MSEKQEFYNQSEKNKPIEASLDIYNQTEKEHRFEKSSELSREEVEKQFKVPVLASIPLYNFEPAKSKGGKKK